MAGFGGSCPDKHKKYSELDQEKYMPHAIHRINHLQLSTLQPSLAKHFAVIQSKVVPSLPCLQVVAKIEFGPGETDTRAVCCRQLFTAITTVLERNEESYVRSASPD